MVPISLKLDYQKLWDDNKQLLSDLIAIPSIYDEATAGPERPCGKGVDDALTFMKDLCLQEGFEVRCYDGHAVSGSFGFGSRIDIPSHVDVVAVSDGWVLPPFSGIFSDGKIHGRGSQDMKSGAFLTWLALKALKDAGYVPKKELRLVYGTDEERTMNDLRYYVDKAGLPLFAFSPDGCFPMAIGEKGAMMWILEGSFQSSVLTLNSGIQPNVIPDLAVCTVSGDCVYKARHIMRLQHIKGAVSLKDSNTEIRVFGKSAHASRPLEGKSAVGAMLRLLSRLTKEDIWKRLSLCLSNPFGIGSGLFTYSQSMGFLTLNPGCFNYENNSLKALVDCRYPINVSSFELTELLQSRLPEINITLPYDDIPTMVSPKDPGVKALKLAYKSIMHSRCGHFVSGGVSYSKVFGRCVTFGPVGRSSERMAHQTDEYITEQDCINSLKIYCNALYELSEAQL